ncbi:acylphosphatase [Evansella halocellulosilytica]|uniref:acylphosphatase n=1 Tax=Evansella halocellulosilytica TaxID=2011013 RepID=UPI000BB72E21|nr:acylphosphatase [Evansella halocellulosilytica]
MEQSWLKHLEGAVPTTGYGKKLSHYTISLEGWRRGLSLKFYTVTDEENLLKYRYSLSNNGKVHHFESSRGDKISDEAYEICDNKHLTKEYLSMAGVPVPEGKRFSSYESDHEVISFADQLGYPLVLKPTNANGGKGVFSNIQSLQEFEEALHYVRHELAYDEVIVEEFVSGDELRLIVIGDRVVGALNRIPANVVGDGKNSIKKLIKKKNALRKKNPHLKSRPIKVDDELKKVLRASGFSMDSVPRDGERVYLRLTSNLSTGGDSVDVTDQLSEDLKQIAINATKAIPGLGVSGIDMIVNDERTTGVIIEANTRPGLGGHLFPMHGAPRDIAKEIVDYYFPETINNKKSNIYFDFNDIIDPLKSRTVKELEISPPPSGELVSKKYIVSGKVQKVGYRKWIKRQALAYKLHGYVENLDNGDVLVVASGTNDAVNEFKFICSEGPEKAIVENVTECEYEKPIKIGFHILKPQSEQHNSFEKISSLSTQSQKINELEKDKIRLEEEKVRLDKEYTKLMNSRMWKFTYPIRIVLDNLKRIMNNKSKEIS